MKKNTKKTPSKKTATRSIQRKDHTDPTTSPTKGSACLFCKIAAGIILAVKIYEDKKTLVFLDIQPSAPGHTMVILKKHGETIMDYSEKDLGTVMDMVKKTTKAIENSLGCHSVTIGINHREETGVHHLHIHLIPRFRNDGGHAIQGVVQNGLYNPPKEDLAKIAKAISLKM